LCNLDSYSHLVLCIWKPQVKIQVRERASVTAARQKSLKIAQGTTPSTVSFGPRILNILLSDDALFGKWSMELDVIRQRLENSYLSLKSKIESRGKKMESKKTGLYLFCLLSKNDELFKRHHIKFGKNGRISLLCLNEMNIDRVVSGLIEFLAC
jgi:aspartate/tyrosine/aromatic aminotransferase